MEHVYGLAQAIALYFRQQNPEVRAIAVGMDGRSHSPQIKELVCNALIDCGFDVIFVGICPTPVFSFANETLEVQAGIMITASHNPKAYNGLKIFLNKKYVFNEGIQEIKKIFLDSQTHPTCPCTRKGIYSQQEIIPTYVNILFHQFKHLKDLPIPIVIDCAHGAAAAVIPTLINVMGWTNARLLYATVDGEFPAHEADPTKEKNLTALKKEIKKNDGFFGVSFDGDADRMAAATEHAITITSGDELAAIFCDAMRQEYGDFAVITDIKCSNAIASQMKGWRLKHIMTPCGIAFVRNAMHEHGAIFGGELSCHFCFADRYFGFDDGIYAMMRLVEAMVKSSKTLQELYEALPARYCSPELRIECTHEQKFEIVESLKKQLLNRPNIYLNSIDGIRAEFHHGCASIRPSNTESVVSARFEGSSQQNLDLIMDEFYMLLVPHLDRAYLRSVLKRDNE